MPVLGLHKNGPISSMGGGVEERGLGPHFSVLDCFLGMPSWEGEVLPSVVFLLVTTPDSKDSPRATLTQMAQVIKWVSQ